MSCPCPSRSCCKRLSLGTLCSRPDVADPLFGHWRLSMFCFIHTEGKSCLATKANVLSVKGGVTFPAKFPAYYRREGSNRTFALRINTGPRQCTHDTPRLEHADIFLLHQVLTCQSSSSSSSFVFILVCKESISSLMRTQLTSK